MLNVAALTPDDWQITKALRLAALLAAPEAFGGTYEDSSKRDEAGWRTWPTSGQPFAAYLDGEPVGMACAYPDPAREKVTLLIGMWVAPKARGTQVASGLIDAVVQWARQRDSDTLALVVYETNVAARKAYAKYGFEEAGMSTEWEHTVVMRLAL